MMQASSVTSLTSAPVLRRGGQRATAAKSCVPAAARQECHPGLDFSRRGLLLGALGAPLLSTTTGIAPPPTLADEYDDENLALLALERGLPPIGNEAPEFSLPTNLGSKNVQLSDYRGSWVTLYFYPRDFTGGCSIEAARFQANLPAFKDAGASVLGVSVDSVDSHAAFCAKKKLTFPLLSDVDGKVSRAYGSLEFYGSYGDLSARNTFLISPEGKLAYEWVDVRPSGHPEEVLRKLSELQARAA